jgi:hypothetical protein
MSENSNVSVSANDLPPVEEDPSPVDCLLTNEFIRPNIPNRMSKTNSPSSATIESPAATVAVESAGSKAVFPAIRNPTLHGSKPSSPSSKMSTPTVGTKTAQSRSTTTSKKNVDCKPAAMPGNELGEHRPLVLPKFSEIQSCMW